MPKSGAVLGKNGWPVWVASISFGIIQGLLLLLIGAYFVLRRKNNNNTENKNNDKNKATAKKTSSSSSSSFLLDRIGGDAALDAAVHRFYDRVLNDKALQVFFDGADVAKLKNHQYRFLKMAFTKIPSTYDVSKVMLDKHKRLFDMGLNADHFDLVAGHLVEALVSLGVTKDCIEEAVSIVGPLRAIFEQGSAIAAAAPTHDDQDDVVLVKKKNAATAAPPTPVYLLDRMGGDAALDAAVEGFYDRILVDPKLERFFNNKGATDIAKLKTHQRRFLKMAFTKIPSTYNVTKVMLDKHERLFAIGLNAQHFDLVAGHLVETLVSLGVAQDCVDEAVAIVSPLRSVFEQGAVMMGGVGVGGQQY